MGCLYSDNSFGEDNGMCTMWSEGDDFPGCDESGFCVCSEDPDPSYLCGDYESDNSCPECGWDLNVSDECECEDW